MSINPNLDPAEFDQTIRPQDDLFRYTNGKWLAETEIPADKGIYSSFHMLADDAEAAVREILESAAADPKPGVSQQIGDLYASFLDEERANELGAAPIAADLKLISEIRQIDDATKLLGEYERTGVSGLFGLWVDNDEGNPDRYIVNLSQGGLGLPDEAYYKDEKHAEIREAYVPHMAQMFELAGWSGEEAAEAARHILAFESSLAAIHWNNVDSRDAEKTYNLTARGHLDKLTPSFDWDIWLAAARFKTEVLAEVNVCQPSFFEGLENLWNSENLEQIKLWLAWQVIRTTSSLLSDDFVNERFAFYGTKLSGTPMNRARWKRGVSLVEGSLGEAIGKIYVEKHFSESAKTRMDELVKFVIEAYRESIKNLDWMTEETKVKALAKLDTFNPKIGYPVKWKDYSSIVIKRDDLVGNARRVAAWVADTELSKIGSKIDRDEWFMSPQTVNAYYNPGFNEIVFPAAILQAPFFSPDADDATNFGGIGSVIGHEIGHGFDDQGSKYDGDGKLESWWSEADREAFEARAAKLIAQYNELTPLQLTDKSQKVNGELTIGENIGDLGGICIALKAYEMSREGKADEIIDGLTGVQRVFLSLARIERAKARDETVIQRLATDPHSPPEFRTNQIVRNVDAFYKAFDVKPGDALWLDPADRVSIW